MPNFLAPLIAPALVGLLLTVVVLTLTTGWQLRIVALALQYVAAAVLIAPVVLWQVAAVKALVGVAVAAILMLTGRQVRFGRAADPRAKESAGPSTGLRLRLAALSRIEFQTNLPFRSAAGVLAATTVWYLVTGSGYAVAGLPLSLNLAAFLLIGLGVLNLGLADELMNTGIGLFMTLNGFELIYASVERSLTVIVLLAGVDFGVALALSHLILLRHGGAEAGD